MIFEDIIQENRGQWDNWLLFFGKGVSSQSLDAITCIERLGQLRTAYRERLRTERAAARLLQARDILCARPISNIRHLPVFGWLSYLRYCPRRYQCMECERHPTTTEQLSWRERNSPHSMVFNDHLLLQLVNATVEDVSRKEGVVYDYV